MTIYDKIRTLREQMGMSQQELAERVGFKTASAVNKIELGLRDINQTKIIAFSKALNTNPSYLMGWDDTKASSKDYINLSVHEEKVITAYRDHPEMQKPVDKLLGLDFSEYEVPRKIAARGGGVETRALSDAEKEAIINNTYAEDL